MKSTIYFILSMLCLCAALGLFFAAFKGASLILVGLGILAAFALGYCFAVASDKHESFFKPY